MVEESMGRVKPFELGGHPGGWATVWDDDRAAATDSGLRGEPEERLLQPDVAAIRDSRGPRGRRRCGRARSGAPDASAVQRRPRGERLVPRAGRGLARKDQAVRRTAHRLAGI